MPPVHTVQESAERGCAFSLNLSIRLQSFLFYIWSA
uniref:Uncharacterized protein n=1 Tax=Anguilla anguilla TaxID=7936 RepID=A0A0E9S8T9_ANGAN